MGDQIRTLALKCPSCGSGLEVSPDMERFACGYCGTEQMVQRRGGTVSLKLITAAISRVQTGTDKTAAELALVRLREELTNVDSTPLPDKSKQEIDQLRQELNQGSNLGCFGMLLALVAFLFGLWMVVGVGFGTTTRVIVLTVVVVVLFLLGRIGLKRLSRDATLVGRIKQLEQEAIQVERDRILAQIATNTALVQDGLENDYSASERG